jgi:hypothetical protein
MTLDRTKIAFDASLNYMKKGFSGSGSLTLGGSLTTVSYTVDHNLGYIPFVVVGAELSASTIWSSNRPYTFTRSSAAGFDHEVQLSYYVTTTTLTVSIRNGSGANIQSGAKSVYWGIYLDA